LTGAGAKFLNQRGNRRFVPARELKDAHALARFDSAAARAWRGRPLSATPMA
jgi:hypothetical protein